MTGSLHTKNQPMKRNISFFCLLTFSILLSAGWNRDNEVAASVAQVSCTDTVTLPFESRECTDWEKFKSISGAVYWQNSLWGITDDSNGRLFQIDPVTGSRIRYIKINTLDSNKFDWEDIAQDDQYIYIAGTGDNSETVKKNREYKKILRIRKSELNNDNSQLTPEVLRFYYQNKRGEKVDCEAIFISNGFIHLVTKDPSVSGHYLLSVTGFNSTGEIKEASFLESFSSPCNLLITGCDVKDDYVVMIGYGRYANGLSCSQIRCAMFKGTLNTQTNKFQLQQSYYLGNENRVGQIESVCYVGQDSVLTINEHGDLDLNDCKIKSKLARYLIP